MNLEILNQLWTEVIAIVVHHELGEMSFYLLLDLVDEQLLRFLKMVLKEFWAYFLGRQVSYVSI